jgi:hypothetical protein
MLISKSLPTFLWDEAVAHAAYLRNRAPTQALNGKTPYEAWHGTKPNVAHLREFGCDVWVLDESINRSKLNPKSKKMTLVGFIDGSKSVRYYDAKSRLIKVSRNVAFNENEEARELEDLVNFPGLQAEGENHQGPSSQTEPKTNPTPYTNPTTPQETKNDPPETRQLRSRENFIDYRRMHQENHKSLTCLT